jgi:hypothetical protein
MERSPRAWIAGMSASLLCGIAWLTIGSYSRGLMTALA